MKHPFIKKFIIIYLSAVALVLAYFIFKTLFMHDKEIKLKSFKLSSEEVNNTEIKKEKKELRLMLLPKR